MPSNAEWSLEMYRIEYHKLRIRYRELVEHYECAKPINEWLQCGDVKDHAGPCGERGGLRGIGPTEVLVQQEEP